MNDNEKEYIRIEKKNGQYFIKLLEKSFKNTPIIDQKSKVLHEDDLIFFPLNENKDLIIKLTELFREKINFEIITKENIINPKYKYNSLREALENKISQDFYRLIPSSYDIIGNIGIIEFDKFNEFQDKSINDIKVKIAKALIKVNKNVKTVFEKTSEIKGTYRLREMAHLFGEDITETTHKENNCLFKLDIKSTFFSPRLVFERNRIATSDIKEGEIIIDLFAGVGPFSIQIAKLHNVIIHAFDINSHAYDYLKKNINLNKLLGKINPYNLDVREILVPSNDLGIKLKNSCDRIIMNLPEKSIDFINIICFLIKDIGGILHYYDFCEKPESVKLAIEKLKEELKKNNWFVEDILESKIVKAFSPKSDLVVLDTLIKPREN